MATRRPARGGASRGSAPRGGAGSRSGGSSRGGSTRGGTSSRASSSSRGGSTRGGAGSRGGASRGATSSRAGAPRRRRGVDDGQRRNKPSEAKGLGGEQVEGRQAVRELLIAQKRKIREIWLANDLDESDVIEDIIQLAGGLRVQVSEVKRRALDDQARSEAPQGVIAFAAPLHEYSLDDLMSSPTPPFLVAVDGVTDPGNLGALLRCCDGAGVSGVLLPRHRTVHVTPTVAKSAAGAVEHVRMCLVSGLPNAITKMRDAGIWVVGLDDAADKSLFDLGDLAAQPICVVLGAEGAGISRLVRERCDMVVNIPMRGALSSLNVSAAAALATYEVARVRTTKTSR